MWRCKITGEITDGTVTVVVDQVDAMVECDAAVRASGTAGSIFKNFVPSAAKCGDAGGQKVVPAVKAPDSDLPRFVVHVHFLVPERRTLAHAMVRVSARNEDGAVALACAKLGRAFATKLSEVEFTEWTVEEEIAAAQPALFSDLPRAEVPNGTPTNLICLCGHHLDRHRGAAGEEGVACQACAVVGRGPCETFVGRSSASNEAIRGFVEMTRSLAKKGVGVHILAGGEDDSPEAKAPRGRRPRKDTGEA